MKVVYAFIMWFTMFDVTTVFEAHTNWVGLDFGYVGGGFIVDLGFITVVMEGDKTGKGCSRRGFSFLRLHELDYDLYMN
jgi:hypothetical protein